MAKRLQSFSVLAKLELDCGIDIRAESLEGALEKARQLDETDFVTMFGDYNNEKLQIETDFVTMFGDYNDGKLRITSVFERE